MRREVLLIISACLLWAAVMAITLLRAQGTTALSQEERPTLIPEGVARYVDVRRATWLR